MTKNETIIAVAIGLLYAIPYDIVLFGEPDGFNPYLLIMVIKDLLILIWGVNAFLRSTSNTIERKLLLAINIQVILHLVSAGLDLMHIWGITSTIEILLIPSQIISVALVGYALYKHPQYEVYKSLLMAQFASFVLIHFELLGRSPFVFLVQFGFAIYIVIKEKQLGVISNRIAVFTIFTTVSTIAGILEMYLG